MARSNGHNGQAAPPVLPQEGVPHWRHPNDPGQHVGGQPAAPHGYAPQFQPGFPPSPDLPPYGQQPHDPYTHPGHAQPGHAQPNYAQPSLAHYAPYPTGAQPQPAPPYTQPPHQQNHQWAAPQADPNAYDLGQFGHGQPQPLSHDPHARNPQQWSQHQYPAPPPHQDPHLPAQHAFAEPVTGQRGPMPFPQAAPAFAGAAGALRADQRPAAPPAQAEEEYDDEDYDEELDEQPKRGRKLMVVGALVGAICVGGGLAYAYKTFSGGKTPLLNAQKQQQPKAASAQAPKVPAKLPEAVPTQAVAAATATDDGVRRVQSIVIAPPGGAAIAPPQPTPPPTSAVMPGMVLDNMPRVPSPAVAPPPAAPTPAATAPLRPSTAPAPQQKVAIVNAPAIPAATAPAAPVSAPPVKVAVPPKKTSDAFNPNAPAGAAGGVVAAVAPPVAKAAGSSGANGYVATVLSTQKGRPEAMKAFADLQQKFPDVLGSKPAEVQEKDLGAEKGVWYRAVVGPPGSREAASSVCTQLKASGYGQCFVTAY